MASHKEKREGKSNDFPSLFITPTRDPPRVFLFSQLLTAQNFRDLAVAFVFIRVVADEFFVEAVADFAVHFPAVADEDAVFQRGVDVDVPSVVFAHVQAHVIIA